MRRPFTPPALRRCGRFELVTAGSFDLVIPNQSAAPAS